MEKDKITHVLFIICILSLCLNIYQAHRESTIYNRHNEACRNLMIENNCMDNISLLENSNNEMYNIDLDNLRGGVYK